MNHPPHPKSTSPFVRRALAVFAIVWVLTLANIGIAAEPTAVLKLAFVSNREHYWYPHVYLYEHDGREAGKIVGSLDPQDKRLDHQPVLGPKGALCVFGYELEGQVGRLKLFDVTSGKPRPEPPLFASANALFSPSLSEDGNLLALTTWNRPGTSPRWDVLLFDLAKQAVVELPGLNTSRNDERRVALSADGNWLAYSTNAPEGRGLTDVWIYDRRTQRVDALPKLNSPAMDNYPCLSRDGRFVCFSSDREGGLGGLDVYLYDRHEERLLDLPGLNSPGHEQSPSLTADGRFLAFVSERFDSAGEHDIYLYDRQLRRLLPTPGLNTDRDDYDPCVIGLSDLPSDFPPGANP